PPATRRAAERQHGWPARLTRERRPLDHLAAHGGHADPLAVHRESDDGARADVRLPRSRRTLDRQHAAVELAAEPDRGVDEGLVRAPERRTDPRTATRQPAAQEL